MRIIKKQPLEDAPLNKTQNKQVSISVINNILSDKIVIMGILNITPDSFYKNSRCIDTNVIKNRIKPKNIVVLVDSGNTRSEFSRIKVETESN